LPLRNVIVAAGMVLAGGCAGTWHSDVTLPERHSLVREQLVVHSDFPLAAQHRLLEDLTARRFDLSRALGLPVSNEPVHVFLFDSADRFKGFMRLHHPEFPERRAFFVETDTWLVVYAHWGDRVAEDLRHEVTHGYLHAMVPNLPLWLDEGLAEYFEVPRGHYGFNRQQLGRLLVRLDRGQWQPDPQRLERLDALSAFDMTADDYAESWAWVHFLLHSRPEHAELLRAYLIELRRDGATTPLSLRLAELPACTDWQHRPDLALIDHVRRLATAAGATGR